MSKHKHSKSQETYVAPGPTKRQKELVYLMIGVLLAVFGTGFIFMILNSASIW